MGDAIRNLHENHAQRMADFMLQAIDHASRPIPGCDDHPKLQDLRTQIAASAKRAVIQWVLSQGAEAEIDHQERFKQEKTNDH